MSDNEMLCHSVEQCHPVPECAPQVVCIDPTLRLRTQLQRAEINLDQAYEDLKKAKRENSELISAQKQLLEERDQFEKERNFYKDALYNLYKRFNCKPVNYRAYKVKTVNTSCHCQA